ncbi:MAG: DUF2235 domain-containing protein [Bdellovibrionota bacterium]
MSKNIVICCDGTGNQFGKNNTNVVHMFEALESNETQKIYYDPGVGTNSRRLIRFSQTLDKVIAMAFGLDLQKNVEDAYYYLMNNYEPGDDIFLFGFSRGAHTVRRLASVLEQVGLLHKGSDNMIFYAMQMYLDKKKDPTTEVSQFKKTFSRYCPVHFLGVWDTVSAESTLLLKPELDGKFSKEVKNAYHAVSIDEKRLNFPPNLWKKDSISSDQKVEEVWFSGVHSDVGGFYNERGLSDITLKWIADAATDAGLQVRSNAFHNLNRNPSAKSFKSWKGIWLLLPLPAYVLLLAIAIVTLHWVIAIPLLKIWEFKFIHQTSNLMWLSLLDWWCVPAAVFVLLVWCTKRAREIPEGAKVHKSVKARIEKTKYKPKNLIEVETTVRWVD